MPQESLSGGYLAGATESISCAGLFSPGKPVVSPRKNRGTLFCNQHTDVQEYSDWADSFQGKGVSTALLLPVYLTLMCLLVDGCKCV